MGRDIRGKLTVLQRVENFPAFHETRKFNAAIFYFEIEVKIKRNKI